MSGTARRMRPVIGVSCYVEAIDRGPWIGQRSVVLPSRYVEQLTRAGALALVLPPQTGSEAAGARGVLARLDGLVIAGGADIEASRYAASPHPKAQPPRPDRDAWELALAEAAVEVGVPMLGICRGMHILAVAAGAALIQHLPDVTGSTVHCPSPGVYANHPVSVVPGSVLAGILGEPTLDVPSYHHQSVEPESLRTTGYRACAWHGDGTLEAMEDPHSQFRLAVQWHPEVGEDARLFEALVAACPR